MLKIKSIKGYPLRCPEPHYKGVLRCVTLARGCIAWNGRLNHSVIDDVMNRITRPGKKTVF